MKGAMAMTDKQMQAECDARTLAEAQVIMADKGRRAAATEAAKGMAKDKKQEADSMQNVADTLFPTMKKK